MEDISTTILESLRRPPRRQTVGVAHAASDKAVDRQMEPIEVCYAC